MLWNASTAVSNSKVCLVRLSDCEMTVQIFGEIYPKKSWWRHQMETFSALLAIGAGNSPVPGEFPAQRPVTRSFDVFFDLHPNKRLSKQWWSWWFETLSCPLWRHRNVSTRFARVVSYPYPFGLHHWHWMNFTVLWHNPKNMGNRSLEYTRGRFRTAYKLLNIKALKISR